MKMSYNFSSWGFELSKTDDLNVLGRYMGALRYTVALDSISDDNLQYLWHIGYYGKIQQKETI